MKILREKYLRSMLNNQSLRAKNHFVELKDRELKDKEEKIKREIIMIIKLKDEIIKDKLKDKIIRDIWTDIRYFWKKKKPEKKKEYNETLIKDGIIRHIRTPFEEEEDHYEPKRVNNFWNNNYIKYESNADKNKNFSLDESLIKI